MSMESEIEIKDELKLNNPIDDISNIMKVAKGTVKIELDNDKGVASGFFLKLERNNKEFYCLMTNAHVFTGSRNLYSSEFYTRIVLFHYALKSGETCFSFHTLQICMNLLQEKIQSEGVLRVFIDD